MEESFEFVLGVPGVCSATADECKGHHRRLMDQVSSGTAGHGDPERK